MMVVATGVVPRVAGSCHRFVGTGFLPEMDEGAFRPRLLDAGRNRARRDRSAGPCRREHSRLDAGDRRHIPTHRRRARSVRDRTERGRHRRASKAARQSHANNLRSDRRRPRQDHRRAAASAAEFVQILSDVINDLAAPPDRSRSSCSVPDLNALEAVREAARARGLEDRRHRRFLQRSE